MMYKMCGTFRMVPPGYVYSIPCARCYYIFASPCARTRVARDTLSSVHIRDVRDSLWKSPRAYAHVARDTKSPGGKREDQTTTSDPPPTHGLSLDSSNLSKACFSHRENCNVSSSTKTVLAGVQEATTFQVLILLFDREVDMAVNHVF